LSGGRTDRVSGAVGKGATTERGGGGTGTAPDLPGIRNRASKSVELERLGGGATAGVGVGCGDTAGGAGSICAANSSGVSPLAAANGGGADANNRRRNSAAEIEVFG
jgi:hypothetical protein